MKKPNLIIFLLIITSLTLALVRIFVANNVATSGIILSKVQEDINKYKLENSLLSTKVYAMSSLTYINSKALELGYKEGKSDLVLTNQKSVALKQ